MVAIRKRHYRKIGVLMLSFGLVLSSCFISVQPIDADTLDDYAAFSLTDDILSSSFRGESVQEPVAPVATSAVLADTASEVPVSLEVMQDDLTEVEEILEEIARKEAEEAARRAREAAERKAAEEAAAKAAADAGLSPTRDLSYTIREVDGYTELEYLAAICYIEAGNQYEGSLAVANVILNRVQSSRFPGTIYDVIYQRNQFALSRMGRILANGSYSNCLKASEDALAGYNNVGNRLSFNATWSVSDARKNQLGDYVIIGGNCFF